LRRVDHDHQPLVHVLLADHVPHRLRTEILIVIIAGRPGRLQNLFASHKGRRRRARERL
jgi:hypothetical protein